MSEYSEKPYLSIIIPIYNTEKHLKKCIESILAQDYKDYELILVDDGSTDNCLRICRNYEKISERILVIHQENGGVTSARKAGLAIARGEYISFIDSDDWIEPGFYSCFLDKDSDVLPDIILASGYQNDEFLEGEIQSEKIHTRLKNGIYNYKSIRKILKREFLFPVLWLKLFKRELIQKNMLLIDDRVCMGEDNLCFYACALDAHAVMLQKNDKYHYVQHRFSATHQHNKEHIKNVRYFTDNLKKIRNIKKADFLDLQWNKMILAVLLKVIIKEFKTKKTFLSLYDMRELEREFWDLNLSKLLLEGEYKAAIRNAEKKEKMILLLYSVKCYRLLNYYIKAVC